MSQYYKPHRNPNWSYGGGRFRLSRSKIDLFLNCPKCFYIDNKLGVARPPGFPFALNSAVDTLFKKEFDVHRADKTPHPLMENYNINAIPFEHPKMDVWRDNFKGVECKHKPTGFAVSGAVDDIWVNPASGELMIVDYKSTSKDGKIEVLDQDWHIGYKRQMEIYQWLMRQNGFDVSNTGYFVYANASKDKEAFNGKLEFEVTLIPYKGNADWVEPTLQKIKETLDSEIVPESHTDCDYCAYRKAARDVLLEKQKGEKTKQPPSLRLTADSKKDGEQQALL